jgi:hypothetical protein
MLAPCSSLVELLFSGGISYFAERVKWSGFSNSQQPVLGGWGESGLYFLLTVSYIDKSAELDKVTKSMSLRLGRCIWLACFFFFHSFFSYSRYHRFVAESDEGPPSAVLTRLVQF